MTEILNLINQLIIRNNLGNQDLALDEIRKLLIENEQLLVDNKKLKSDLERKEEIVKYLQQKLFGKKTEAIAPDQLKLFNEVELETDKKCSEDSGPDQDAQDKDEDPDPKKLKRKVKKISEEERKLAMESLPVVQEIIELPKDQRVCPNDGSELKEKGRKVTRQIEIVPRHVQVREVVEIEYGCGICDEEKDAKAEGLGILPTTMASPSLLATIWVEKYLNGLPLYRIEQILARENIFIPRNTMARWVIDGASFLDPIINLLVDDMFDSRYIGIDETTVQVLKEEGRKAESSSYMWVRHSLTEKGQIILFHYACSRARTVAQELLDGFKGHVQCDGYAAYYYIDTEDGMIRVGCWDHARRYFKIAWDVADKKGISNNFLILIGKLYIIERDIADLSPDERLKIRQEKSTKILSKIKELLDRSEKIYPPKSKIGEAITYTKKQWKSLNQFVKDGKIRISNILTENAIRPFAIGRKNWLFSDTPAGAEASAKIYSLLTTAAANGLNPTEYLIKIFLELPRCNTLEDYIKLLPYKPNKTSNSS